MHRVLNLVPTVPQTAMVRFFLRSNMCTLLWGKDTKKKADKEKVVERVADEIPSELEDELDLHAHKNTNTRKHVNKKYR